METAAKMLHMCVEVVTVKPLMQKAKLKVLAGSDESLGADEGLLGTWYRRHNSQDFISVRRFMKVFRSSNGFAEDIEPGVISITLKMEATVTYNVTKGKHV